MKEVIILRENVQAVLDAAKLAKVSAMNDQFVPSYSLEPNHTYVLIDDMLISTPRVTSIEGSDGVKKSVSFMECYIADVTVPEDIKFHKISCGQLYNQFKIIETNERKFKTVNLRELGDGELLTPSLVLLGQALSKGDIKISYKDIVPCELPVTNELKDVPFFEGTLETHDAIRAKFNAWKK